MQWLQFSPHLTEESSGTSNIGLSSQTEGVGKQSRDVSVSQVPNDRPQARQSIGDHWILERENR